KSNTIKIDIHGFDAQNGTAMILSSSALQDHNTFEQPEKVSPKVFKDFTLKKGVLQLTLPPFSVVVVELK
ncbi:MAG: alpha-N-arabinofuranosidase, partial [Cyclobacteriaceae bacterium]|nr:alpha-N-arabinofuranosidase [Cyclobacteriaceae bacterium]